MTAIETRLLGRGLPLGFPNTIPTSSLYRGYLWGKRNQERLATSGQMALSNITRELAQRGVRLEVGHGS
jgi:hypothetical protein